jgi:hypothetical protein
MAQAVPVYRVKVHPDGVAIYEQFLRSATHQNAMSRGALLDLLQHLMHG